MDWMQAILTRYRPEGEVCGAKGVATAETTLEEESDGGCIVWGDGGSYKTYTSLDDLMV